MKGAIRGGNGPDADGISFCSVKEKPLKPLALGVCSNMLHNLSFPQDIHFIFL